MHHAKMLGGVFNESRKSYPKNNSCVATYVSSHKTSKRVKQDMLGTAGEVGTHS